jgi:hypothetical protein
MCPGALASTSTGFSGEVSGSLERKTVHVTAASLSSFLICVKSKTGIYNLPLNDTVIISAVENARNKKPGAFGPGLLKLYAYPIVM